MGGVMFFFSLTLGTIFLARDNYIGYYLLLFALGFGLIGFLDDYIKIVKKRSLGLTAKQKIVGQLGLSCLLVFLAVHFLKISTAVMIPLFGWTVDLGWLYIPFLVFLIVGTTNAVNLTDGLDGLASGVTMIVALGYTLIGILCQQYAVVILALRWWAVAWAFWCLTIIRPRCSWAIQGHWLWAARWLLWPL